MLRYRWRKQRGDPLNLIRIMPAKGWDLRILPLPAPLRGRSMSRTCGLAANQERAAL